VVVSQKGRHLLRRDLGRSIADEQNVATLERGRKRIVEDLDPFLVPAGFFLGLARRR